MNFNFESPAKIIFGTGKIKELKDIIKPISDNIIIITGKSNRYNQIFQDLKNNGIDYTIYNVEKEPLIEDVDRAVSLAKKNLSTLVLGIGGGSVIDVAKAVSIMLLNPGEVLDYLEVVGKGETLREPSMPCIAIPTTSGTGAEVTKNSVLKSITHQRKVSMRSSMMIPEFVIIDPELMLSLPKDITTYTGMDALTQVIEPFISRLGNPFTDMLCRDAIKKAIPSLLILQSEPQNIKARTDMAYVSLIGGLALANAKLGAVHGFAGPIGGMFDIPHGLVCAALLPNTLKLNLAAVKKRGSREQLEKYDELATLLLGDESKKAEDAIKYLMELNGTLNIPGLSSYGIKKGDITEIVNQSKNSSSMKGNTIPLTEDEMILIMQDSL